MSPLEIDSDDAYSLMMETERCPMVSIQLTYLDRTPRREIHVNTRDHTLRLDLVQGVFELDGVPETVTIERDVTYREEHRLMLSGDATQLCNLTEAVETLNTIEAAERAALTRTWIQR